MRRNRKEYLQEQYRNNRDVVLARAKDRYAKNRDCIRQQASQRYKRDLVGVMLGRAKQRAKNRGLPFSIDRSDIRIPDVCPILGLTLARNIGGSAAPNSPSLDRIDSSIGYVKGNVQVISYRANQMKSDASVDELCLFADYIKDKMKRDA